MTMSSRDRIDAAIAGQPVDRPPISLWRHFPEEDQTAEGLAAATLRWQTRFPGDFVKFMPPGDYPIIDWGGVTVYEGARGGTRTTTTLPVREPGDWERLRSVDVRAGFNAVVVEAVKRTRERLDPDVPLLQTIFSPLTIAMKLAGGQAIQACREQPAALHATLAVIRDVTRAMVEASLAAGADGFFFATQCADEGLMTVEEYRAFGVPYDRDVLVAAGGGGISLLHLHGSRPMFALAADYPVQIVNWHDRHAGPSLAAGREASGRCVAGGIDERLIATRPAAEVAGEVREAITATGGVGVIVTPGCVIPIDTPEATVAAALRAAEA